MDYSHDDTELIKQPVGYWTWAAAEAVVTRTRAALGQIGLTQPQWWILNRLAGGEGDGTRGELTRVLSGYLAVGDAGIGAEIDMAVARGWVTETAGDEVALTEEGRTLQARAAALQDDLWKERHAGISDDEYLVTVKVLQRLIHNTGGRAWHH
ncbi:MarR family winged helix-turn-helix transcriptional regulator [Streptomyces sp. NPDC048507]|uniref:MarR family winged helix-turn-helix transcriptional regulator n=1 Tax=Streptomyces sp. NPDC048507 TaxID=3365560 RepID=UPI00371830B9